MTILTKEQVAEIREWLSKNTVKPRASTTVRWLIANEVKAVLASHEALRTEVEGLTAERDTLAVLHVKAGLERDAALETNEAIKKQHLSKLIALGRQRDRMAKALREIVKANDEWLSAVAGFGIDDPIADAIKAGRTALSDMPVSKPADADTSWLPEMFLWSDETFGVRGGRMSAVKLIDEAAEARDAPDDIDEWADCLMVTIDGARREGHSFAALMAAAHRKFRILKTRVWGPPTAEGTRQHIPIEGTTLTVSDQKIEDTMSPGKGLDICPSCNGSGFADAGCVASCWQCNGSGMTASGLESLTGGGE